MRDSSESPPVQELAARVETRTGYLREAQFESGPRAEPSALLQKWMAACSPRRGYVCTPHSRSGEPVSGSDACGTVSSVQEIETGNFAVSRWVLCPPSSIKIVNWNINRGLQLEGVIEFLARAKADIILLQETDLNARRTHRLNIAREISQKLQMNYVFGREFQELTQGSSRSPAYHGQATLARWPLSNPRILRFQKQSNFWRPHWFLPEIDPFQERIGGRLALVCEADVAGKMIVTYNLHLESKGDDRLRCSQLEETFEDSRQYNARTPVLLAGDFNLDASDGTVASAISRAQFQDAFRNQHLRTTPDSFFADGRTIDWVFSRGPVRSSQPQVHRSVSASDHYPLSVTFDFA